MPTSLSDDRSRQPPRDEVFVSARNGIRHPSGVYARALVGLIRAAKTLESTLDADLRAGHDISLHEYEVLLHLAAFAPAGQLPMTQLARQAPLSQSRVSRLVAKLEHHGLVRRVTDDRDARAVVVSLTDAGLARLRHAQNTHHRGLNEGLFTRLTPDEITELARLTGKLLGSGDAAQ